MDFYQVYRDSNSKQKRLHCRKLTCSKTLFSKPAKRKNFIRLIQWSLQAGLNTYRTLKFLKPFWGLLFSNRIQFIVQGIYNRLDLINRWSVHCGRVGSYCFSSSCFFILSSSWSSKLEEWRKKDWGTSEEICWATLVSGNSGKKIFHVSSPLVS